MTSRPAPVRVTLVDESELAVAGIGALLAPYGDRVAYVDNREALARPDDLDVLLYEPVDLSGTSDALLRDLQDRVRAPSAVFSWAARADLPVPPARPYLSKSLTGAQLVVHLEDLAAGRYDDGTVDTEGGAVAAAVGPDVAASRREPSVLTPREGDILELIVAGMSNREIGEELGLSLNSVKTYVRTAYRKMGVSRRTQAMRWALDRGIGVPEGDEPVGDRPRSLVG